MINLGNKLYRIANSTMGALFSQGELAQLTYQAFDSYATQIKNSNVEKIKITYPIGYTPQKKPIQHEYEYTKKDLVERYAYLGFNQLPINGVYQLVTLIEAMFADILRAIIIKYPQKIGNKKNVLAANILNSKTIEEIKNHIVDSIINELSYKSPKEFSEEFCKYTSINMLELPAYHKYIELKATRDIYIHNKGIANDTYVYKSDSHSRTESGKLLPIDVQYFLESYEYCLKICEFLEGKLNDKWPSSEYEQKKEKGNKKHITTLST